MAFPFPIKRLRPALLWNGNHLGYLPRRIRRMSSQVEPAGITQAAKAPFFYLIEPLHTNGTRASLSTAWEAAITKYYGKGDEVNELPFKIVDGRLGSFDPSLAQCDCMVSPANSFGIMDGGYDMALSLAFKGPTNDIWKITNHVQTYIQDQWRGYIPPGSCTIVPLPPDLAKLNNPWNARFMAVLPTMRIPEDVRWHQDLVYNSMWTLLVAIDNWNRAHIDEVDGPPIKSVMTSGLATGYGKVSSTKCAEQMLLAVKHFNQGVPDHLRWNDVDERQKEIANTIALNE